MDLTLFTSLLALRDELYDNLNEHMTPATTAANVAKEKRAPGPTASADLLRRMSKERDIVLTALSRAKPTTDATIKELLRAAAAPLPAIEVPSPTPTVTIAAQPSAVQPGAAKPKTKSKAKRRQP